MFETNVIVSGFVERKKEKNPIAIAFQKVLLSVILADVISSDFSHNRLTLLRPLRF